MAMLLRRGFWTFILEPMVRWLPKSFSPIRVLALRAMGAKVASSCVILPGVKVLMPWNLVLEDHVAIGRGVDLYNFATIHIQRMSVVSQGSYLCTGSHDFTHPHMPLTYAPIHIGAECWLAAEVFVCPGVSIPDGVVLGARSLVPKSLPKAWTIYGGNPCRPLGPRVMQSLPKNHKN
jgi:putative colanic acid biosynthesis acetyltransferase WcaF